MTAGRISPFLVALGVFWLLWAEPSAVPAQSKPGAGPLGAIAPRAGEEDLPLRITADRLEAEQEKRLIIFSGQVKAQRGESVLFCDELKVYYQSSPSPPATSPAPAADRPQDILGGMGGGEKIERIEARGRVRYVQGDKVATGDTAIYYQDRAEIVLLGNPQVWQGDNNLKGDRIIFNTRENRVMVESSAKQRVEAYLYQGGPNSAGGPGKGKARPAKKEAPAADRRP
jgi:lipopolysaccharide export system protein LptA